MAPTDLERIAVLENQYRMIEARSARIEKKVDEMYDVLIGARSVRWLLVAIAMTISFFVGLWAKLHFFGK